MLKDITKRQLDRMGNKEAVIRLTRQFFEHKITHEQYLDAIKYVRNRMDLKDQQLKGIESGINELF